jgi:glycosyltransferase involved in cell wall biosynthesis
MTKIIKVYHISHGFYPSPGGVQNHVYNLTKELTKIGVNIKVFIPRREMSISQTPGIETNIQLVEVGIETRNTSLINKALSNYVSLADWLARAIIDWRNADIVHIHSPASPKYFTVLPGMTVSPQWLVKKIDLLSRPIVATFHGLYADYNVKNIKFDKMSVEVSNFFIGVDRTICRGLVKYYGVPPDKVFHIPNGVQGELLEIGKKRIRRVDVDTLSEIILVPRRIDRKNGNIFAVRAFALIAKEFPNARLVLTGFNSGDLEYQQEIINEIKRLKLESRVHLLPLIPTRKMINLYLISRVTVIPSIWEATSLAALESMALGVPVIASTTGGLPEIVDEEVGYLHKPMDVEALAKGMERALGDKNEYVKKVYRSVKRMEEYTWDKIALRTMEVYKRVLEYHVSRF